MRWVKSGGRISDFVECDLAWLLCCADRVLYCCNVFTIPALTNCIAPNVSLLIIPSVFRSLSLRLPRLLRVGHKNIKHSHCVGPIWVLPRWLHALKFSHKERRVSTRSNSLLIASICLQRCWWVCGLDWDLSKEWFRPYRALLSYKDSRLQLFFSSFCFTHKKSKKKERFLVVWTIFLDFQPPTHSAAFIPFPFFLCIPCLGHMSFLHAALLWCGVFCVFLVRALCPIPSLFLEQSLSHDTTSLRGDTIDPCAVQRWCFQLPLVAVLPVRLWTHHSP